MCGAIRFRLIAPPYEVDYCHCHSCRKHTGAPVSAFADCKRAVFELLRGEIAIYESSPGVRRGFCAKCGSTLTYESEDVADEVHIHIGALDRPEDFPPHGTPTFPEDRLPWFKIAGVD